MHELSLAQNILDIVREYLPKQQATLKEVHVQIGSSLAVVPESLQFCYETLVQNTPYAASKMVIHLLPVKAICTICNTTTVVNNAQFICPECGAHNLKTVQGNELIVSHLEVD
jgi:hydrogenase nickel incorporation protein HypA/HybF